MRLHETDQNSRSWVLFGLPALLMLAASPASAQLEGNSEPGFHIIGAQAGVAYYTVGTPYGAVAPRGLFGSDYGFAGSTMVQYDKPGLRTSFSAHYTASYSGRLRYTEWDALTHRIALSLQHTFSRKLYFAGELIGHTSNLEQYQFTPAPFSAIALASAKFSDLGSGVALQTPTTPVMASAAAIAPPVTLPPPLLLYGNQILTVTLAGRFRYRRSPTTTWLFDAVGARVQVIEPNRAIPDLPLLPQSTMAGVLFGLAHLVSPRTEFRAEFSSQRVISRLQDYYINSGTVSMGRVFSRNWFARSAAGVGYFTSLRGSYAIPQGPQFLYDGAVGFKTHDHTFTVSQRRTIGQMYLYGTLSATETEAAWKWARPARPWSLYATAMYQSMHGGFVGGTHNWLGLAGMSWKITHTVTGRLEYSYLRYWTRAGSTIPSFDQGICRLIVGWQRIAAN